jgi:hypothetical protein
MIYELFLEGQLADIRQDLGMQLSYNIDDVNKYGSRDTSFSKTIVLPGTAKNNKLFGFVGELGSNNPYANGAANIDANFNVAQTTKAELRINGLLLLKGVFRLTGIIHERGHIEYEGNLFGELGGFIAAIGAGKLEDLDFSAYNHTYTWNNIVNSWNTVNGSGYYYPLIDHGTYSANKINYDYRTFRPALYVKEYIDKIFAGSGYTYESNFFDSAFFKKLTVPCNLSTITKKTTDLLHAIRNTNKNLQYSDGSLPYNDDKTTILDYPIIVFTNGFSDDGDPNFTYNLSQTTTVNISYQLNLTVYPDPIGDDNRPGFLGEQRLHKMKVTLFKNGDILNIVERQFFYFSSILHTYDLSINENIQTTINQNDTFKVQLDYLGVFNQLSYVTYSSLKIISTNPITANILLNDPIYLDELIPKNILKKDFFTWIMKMFNLYVTEDKVREKHLLIEPYVDYYDLSDPEDWTYKVARDKSWNIKPMGMLNGRFFEYKYKEDNDFYNESFKKKFNLPYGSILEDTKFQFAKEKQTIEIGFSPSVLIQYQNTDKVVTAIYKKSSGNSVDQEERMDSNIRILMAKKMTGVSSWSITNNGSALGSPLTVYGYAGHFDDPVNPTKDINFGASKEIYFDPNVYPTNNLFNDYWSGYIAEIADKDSKLLSCHVYLNDLDIAQLDFSKPVFIDGVLWRINKVMDYDSTSGELTKVELLKVINNG